MAIVQGSNCKLIYDQETTFGTTPASPDALIIAFKDEGFTQDIELITSDVMTGNRNASAPVAGNRSVKGSLSTELSAYGQARLFKNLLGGLTTTGTGPAYIHTFKVGALPVSMCFEKQITDLTKFFLYNGVRISKGSLEFKPAGFIATSFDFVGQKETVSGASFDATATDLGHNPFEGFQGAILEGGVSIGTVTSLKVDIDNDIQSDLYTIGGGGVVAALPAGKVKVSGSATVIFDSTTLYDKAVAGTESSIKVTLTKGLGDGTTGNESFELLIPELRFKASTPVIKDSKGLMLDLPFEAYYSNSTEATSIQVVLKNTQATI